MADIANFTGKFRLQGPDSDRVTKRPRANLTCVPCRRAKLRCDKGQPCSSCVKRDDAARCSYHSSAGASEQSTDRHSVAEQRLAHLETMVLQLMQGRNGLQHDEVTSPESESTSTVGLVSTVQPVKAGSTDTTDMYAGSTHWSAMLEDIQELRLVLNNDEALGNSRDETAKGECQEVIYGLPSCYSLQELVTTFLPSRPNVDRLLAIYFSGETFILPILHTGYFHRQCDQFWDAPLHADPLWLSMLFSLCYMAEKIVSSSGASVVGTDAAALQTAAGQCLVLGRYHRPQRYAPEALLLYAQAKNFHGLDLSPDVGVVLGLAVRHAYYMGYHRDPDSVGLFSPFEGEMRRRFWATCKQFDLMVSFQLGLPSHIRLENSDTRSPRNLLDSDFDETTTKLPESRPEDQPTRFLWFMVKDRQMVTFSRICQDALSFCHTGHERVQQLDAEVHQMYASVPSILRSRPFADSAMDAPFLIMTRLYIELIYLKSLCVLHRRQMVESRPDNVHAGAQAAAKLVTRFLDMYAEFSPGGQLQTHRWMFNSYTLHDFLLGVTTACLAVSIIRQHPDPAVRALARDMQVPDLLRRALRVCTDVSHASKDAARVARAVGLVLDHDHDHDLAGAVSDLTTGSSSTTTIGRRSQDGNEWWMTPQLGRGGQWHDGMTTTTSTMPTDASGMMVFRQLDPFDFINNPMQEADLDWSILDGGFDLG